MKNLHQTVQEIALAVPRYSVRECHRYAAKLLEELEKRKIHGQIVRLAALGGRGFIVPKNPNLLLPFKVSLEMAIATNGRHWGVLVEDFVYEQLIPGGIPLSQWAMQYDCDTHAFLVSVVASFEAE